MYRPVKVAAISFKPTKWEKAANADRMEALFVEAARESPQLILTTEGALEGYVIMEVIEGRAPADAVLAVAEPLDGPFIRRFQGLARQLQTCLCFGFAERIGEEVYNCAIFLDSEGEICGRYHKVQLAEGAHATWHFNRVGRELRAFDTPVGRVGMVICNDRWNPLIVRTLVLDGAQVIFIPSYGDKSRKQNAAVLARARENGVPIVEANVGMNLVVSMGEIVAYQWGNDRIAHATVEIPALPSPERARASEQAYLDQQGPEMEHRYQRTLERVQALADPVDSAAPAAARVPALPTP